MQVKKFVAGDMRRALDMVKLTLGADAMILSTTRTNKGVELLAACEQDIEKEKAALTPFDDSETLSADDLNSSNRIQAPATHQKPLEFEPPSYKDAKGLASGKTKAELVQELDRARLKMIESRKQDKMTITDWADQQLSSKPQSLSSTAVKPESNSAAISQQDCKSPAEDSVHTSNEINSLKEEIVGLKALFEEQMKALTQQARSSKEPAIHTQNAPRQAEIMSLKLSKKGREKSGTVSANIKSAKTEKSPFNAIIAQRFAKLGIQKNTLNKVLSSIDTSGQTRALTKEELWPEALAKLAHLIPVDLSDNVAKGGVFTLLGPTGVGKTTTVAKLAARHVLTQGAHDVALVTTDTYRIAAHDQLCSLGRILNVSVTVVDQLSELPAVVERLKTRHRLVIIDTPGMNHQDPLLSEHLEAIKQVTDMNMLLVLSANSQYQMMKASIHAYRKPSIDGVVLTKIDESASLGEAISLLVDVGIPLAYVTDGQAVPDDIDVIKAHQLIAKCIQLAKHYRAENSATV